MDEIVKQSEPLWQAIIEYSILGALVLLLCIMLILLFRQYLKTVKEHQAEIAKKDKAIHALEAKILENLNGMNAMVTTFISSDENSKDKMLETMRSTIQTAMVDLKSFILSQGGITKNKEGS